MAEIEDIKAILSQKGMRLSDTFSWKDMQYCWADQIYPETGALFAKYLLFPLSLSEWEKLRFLEEQFSTDVVEKTYYTLRSDLCWNLYLACVLSDEDFAQIDRQNRFEFESSTEYIRKLVLMESEIKDRLPVGYTLFLPGGQPVTQPEQVWREILTEEYEFCLDGFDSDRFKRIALGTILQKKASAGTLSVPTEKVVSVQHIHIPQNFRPHFYNRDIELPCCKANLLAGANGSGKTSVFSAIELAMTGAVHKQRTLPQDSAEQADVSVLLKKDEGEIEVKKVSTPSEKKKREAKWYNNRAENRTAEQLNVSFHRFNYFSVDDTYLFASEQPNHRDIFSKILYGPETAAKWKNIESWKEKCEQEVSRLDSANEQLAMRQKDLPKKTVDEHGLRSYIAQSGLNIAPDASIEEILETAARIQAEINQVRFYSPIPSRSDVLAAKQQTGEQFSSVSARNTELISQMKADTDALEERNKRIEQMKGHLNRVQKRINDLSPLNGLQKKLKFMVDHQEQFAQIKKLQKKIGIQQKTLDELQMYWGKHEKLQSCLVFPDIHTGDTVAALDAKLFEIDGKIANAKEQMDQQKQLLGQLRSIGEQLAGQNPSMHRCPLCGTEGIGAEDILQHLRKEQEDTSAELSDLFLEKRNLNDRLKKIQLADAILSAHRDAQELYPELQGEMPLASFEYVRKQRAQSMDDLQEIRNAFLYLKEELQQQCKEELGNIDFDEIFDAESSAQRILVRNSYTECENLKGMQLVLWISAIHNRLLQEKNNLETEISSLPTQSGKDPLQAAQAEQESCQKQLVSLETAARKWDRLLKFWEKVSPWLLEGAGEMDGPALEAHCEKLKSDVENITLYSERQQENKRLTDTMTANKKRRHAYQDVLERLEKLQKPEAYAQEFIQQNIQQISRIFLSLHLPQEFSCLDMDGNDLIGRRGEEKVLVVNMSTGQRTALVLSVFFQLHLSNSAVPEFLLIDEPVANIDDLNVLSLMDFLRELVVSHGRQIFFTTASRNVAQLFRRKFSFLEKDFQHLYFSRRSTDKLEICRKTYDQEKLLTNEILPVE